ncbi:MAG TPA: CBASS cGAMP-activated phospholipase [Acidimicrobiia bacterium]|nr:CBASS cGAMP-activated phospholipase [Acidimicrobiia bacterium]
MKEPAHPDPDSSNPAQQDPTADRFQILALDGGGAKGLFSADILAHLEQDLNVSVTDHFDLIAGTSTGGIIALALGAGLSPSQVVDLYRELTSNVFSARHRLNPTRLFRSTYSQKALVKTLESVFGDRRLEDSHKRLIIPSWDLRTNKVHIFKTPHHSRLTRDRAVRMVDVALATSAAPTFLPVARVAGGRLIDGGVWANNPSVVAIAEATSMLDVPLESVHVLNIGTTEALTRYANGLDRGGVVQWSTKATSVVMAAGSQGARGTAEHLLGQQRYERFDAEVSKGEFKLDKVDSDELRGWASSRSRELSPIFTQRFQPHLAGKYEPTSPQEVNT